MNVEQIAPSALFPEEVALLEKSVATDSSGTDLTAVLGEVAAGKAALWLMSCEQQPTMRGVAVTQVLNEPAGRELYIWHVAGTKGSFLYFYEEFIEQMTKYAEHWNCVRIGSGSNPTSARLLKARGWTHQYSYMTLEV